MFFSTDLLSIRGGKFGTVWLLATTKDRQSVIKKKKSELLKTDMTKLCQELIKMFPAGPCTGKAQEFLAEDLLNPGVWDLHQPEAAVRRPEEKRRRSAWTQSWWARWRWY